MDNNEYKQILKLYPEFNKIYGPYVRKQDGRKIIILYDGNKRSTRLLAKVRLEVKLGKRLKENEQVDHKDDDRTNDESNNLQVLTQYQNIIKSIVPEKIFKGFCPECKKEFQRPLRFVKRNLLLDKAGPFCSRICAGKHNQRK